MPSFNSKPFIKIILVIFKPYAKREIIQLIHQIIKENVLERNQTRIREEIIDAFK